MGGQPYYILFAGVNGAGKSTLFRTGLWQHGGITTSLPRVNTDEIIVENGWDWSSEADQIKAGRMAVRRIRGFLDERESFNQETTLTGRSIMRNIRRARELGYCIVMFYVCVKDPVIANNRIEQRGSAGGHLIDSAAVERRYDSSLSNLIEVIPLCDEVYLYDNTILLELETRFEKGELAYFNPSEPGLAWIARVVGALGWHEFAWT